MIFPRRFDAAGYSDTKEILAAVESYINEMQDLVEQNDSLVKKKLRELENDTGLLRTQMNADNTSVTGRLTVLERDVEGLWAAVEDLQPDEEN